MCWQKPHRADESYFRLNTALPITASASPPVKDFPNHRRAEIVSNQIRFARARFFS